MKQKVFMALSVLCLFSCTAPTASKTTADCNRLQVKAEIEAALRQIADCNKRKDIDCFMVAFDSSFVLESNEAADKDRVIIKDTIRKDILRDWGIIKTMYEVERWVDSIYVPAPDTAIVFTNQFYHRSFVKPNGLPGEDDVVTTQKHRETWIRRNTGWKQSRIKELGGAIYVNGRPYHQ
jgi:hypothetical protein